MRQAALSGDAGEQRHQRSALLRYANDHRPVHRERVPGAGVVAIADRGREPDRLSTFGTGDQPTCPSG
jgi:hypothetical protein